MVATRAGGACGARRGAAAPPGLAPEGAPPSAGLKPPANAERAKAVRGMAPGLPPGLTPSAALTGASDESARTGLHTAEAGAHATGAWDLAGLRRSARLAAQPAPLQASGLVKPPCGAFAAGGGPPGFPGGGVAGSKRPLSGVFDGPKAAWCGPGPAAGGPPGRPLTRAAKRQRHAIIQGQDPLQGGLGLGGGGGPSPAGGAASGGAGAAAAPHHHKAAPQEAGEAPAGGRAAPSGGDAAAGGGCSAESELGDLCCESPLEVSNSEHASDCVESDVARSHLVGKYAKGHGQSVFKALKAREGDYAPDAEYLRHHGLSARGMCLKTYIDEHMRYILFGWIGEVTFDMGFNLETLFLASNITDRYLSVKKGVSRRKLQLVAITSVLIASKVEEIHVPNIDCFARMTAGENDVDDVRGMEVEILKCLEYRLHCPTVATYLGIIDCVVHKDDTSRLSSVGHFLSELALVDYKMLQFPASLVASAVAWCARLLLNQAPWTGELQALTGYTPKELLPCVDLLMSWHRHTYQNAQSAAASAPHLHIYTKYKANRHFQVAQIPPPFDG